MKKKSPRSKAISYRDSSGDGIFADESFIMTGLGGEGQRLRYYFVISRLNNASFTRRQKDIIHDQFNKISQEFDSSIEEIKFFKNYALIKILISADTAPQDLIDEGMHSCNSFEKFLRFHFYITNVKKPTRKEIQDYLNEV